MTASQFEVQRMPRELDQITAQYRKQLKEMNGLFNLLVGAKLCDIGLPSKIDSLIKRLEEASSGLMEKEVKVERERQVVMDLHIILDVSRQTVEAKTMHLGQEEKAKEEAQNIRFKEFQKIHKLQAEKAMMEKEIIPRKAKLRTTMKKLDEKNEKLRNLEFFHSSLSQHTAQDIVNLKKETEESREQRTLWDRQNFDLIKQVVLMKVSPELLATLQADVSELKRMIQGSVTWHEEELESKLFYSTRSRELKHRLLYFRSLLNRVERSGRGETTEEHQDESQDDLGSNNKSDNILVDGSPGVDAKEVEKYLTDQYGWRVMADYTMLRRLKEEIGVQGLACLVEKIRLQGTNQKGSTIGGHYTDCEEKKMEQALRTIALEYKAQEENRGLFRVPGIPVTPSLPPLAPSSTRSSPVHQRYQQQQQHSHYLQMPATIGLHPAVSPSSMSACSHTSAFTSNSALSRQSSGGSIKQKSSISKIKKLFKI